MFRKGIIFFIVLSLFVLFIAGCGDRTGEPFENIKPTIYITSYGGVNTPEAISDSILFQQMVYWEAYDPDGVVEFYSYRILDESETPISTPGNEYLNEDGWVLHYETGADESIPMDDPAAQTTIWTPKVRAEINFPANGTLITLPNGDPELDPVTGNFMYEPVTSKFEIKCIDDRDDESDIFERYFKSTSKTPSVLTIQSTQGAINEKRIGTGVIFDFRISDSDPLIGDAPNYFIFKIEKINIADGTVIPESEGGYPDYSNQANWLSTRGQEDVTNFMMTQKTNPPLQINTPDSDSTFADSTFLTAIAYDLAGIASESYTISFAVKDGFYPGTMIYNGYDPNGIGEPGYDYNDTYAMGDNHFSTKKPDYLSNTTIAEEMTPEGVNYALPLWIDRDSVFTAINSPDLKIYLHWGHEGEYGVMGATNEAPPIITNKTFDQRLGRVIDETTKDIYFTELKYYDLQLDGEAYRYPPLPPIGEYLQVDEDGEEWLRVPIGADIDQRTILYGLEPGEHIFRVRAVDLSDEGDPTPAEMVINIVELIPAEEKSGILILDDDIDSAWSPDVLIDTLYIQMLQDYTGDIDVFDFMENSTSDAEPETFNSLLHFGQDVISPVDIQKYKLIIYHSDYASGIGGVFYKNTNSFRQYFDSGGNMVASLGNNVDRAYTQCNATTSFLLEENFGIPLHIGDDSPFAIEQISSSPMTNPFFKGANAVDGFETDIDLELEDPMIALIGMRQGLGPCSYFQEEVNAEPIYRYISKTTDAPVAPPTDEQYEQYHDQTVAIKYFNEETLNTNYMFGFSLPFMELEDTRAMFNEILEDLGM